MYRTAQLVTLASWNVELISDAGADVGAVLTSAGGAVVARGDYGIVFNYDSTINSTYIPIR